MGTGHYVFLCGCSPTAGIICSVHCQWQGCLQLARGEHTDSCIKGEREAAATAAAHDAQPAEVA